MIARFGGVTETRCLNQKNKKGRPVIYFVCVLSRTFTELVRSTYYVKSKYKNSSVELVETPPSFLKVLRTLSLF